MDPYEISIFFPQNNLNDTSQFCEHILEIYIYRKICYNRDIRTTLRHFWIVSGWQRYFSISVPLTHHYKKCPVMWTIIELISKNPEISLSSRNNPEMSQRSLDVPIVANFSIYIFPGYVHWTGWYHLKYYFSIDHHSFGMSETFKKSQMSEFFDVSAGCLSERMMICRYYMPNA